MKKFQFRGASLAEVLVTGSVGLTIVAAGAAYFHVQQKFVVKAAARQTQTENVAKHTQMQRDIENAGTFWPVPWAGLVAYNNIRSTLGADGRPLACLPNGINPVVTGPTHFLNERQDGDRNIDCQAPFTVNAPKDPQGGAQAFPDDQPTGKIQRVVPFTDAIEFFTGRQVAGHVVATAPDADTYASGHPIRNSSYVTMENTDPFLPADSGKRALLLFVDHDHSMNPKKGRGWCLADTVSNIATNQTTFKVRNIITSEVMKAADPTTGYEYEQLAYGILPRKYFFAEQNNAIYPGNPIGDRMVSPHGVWNPNGTNTVYPTDFTNSGVQAYKVESPCPRPNMAVYILNTHVRYFVGQKAGIRGLYRQSNQLDDGSFDMMGTLQAPKLVAEEIDDMQIVYRLSNKQPPWMSTQLPGTSELVNTNNYPAVAFGNMVGVGTPATHEVHANYTFTTVSPPDGDHQVLGMPMGRFATPSDYAANDYKKMKSGYIVSPVLERIKGCEPSDADAGVSEACKALHFDWGRFPTGSEMATYYGDATNSVQAPHEMYVIGAYVHLLSAPADAEPYWKTSGAERPKTTSGTGLVGEVKIGDVKYLSERPVRIVSFPVQFKGFEALGYVW